MKRTDFRSNLSLVSCSWFQIGNGRYAWEGQDNKMNKYLKTDVKGIGTPLRNTYALVAVRTMDESQ